MKIDLHTHSSVSDGTDTPAQLIEKAKTTGLDVVGITDHDTVGGWVEATQAAEKNRITLVPGMETTTNYQGVIVHLLAYLFDPTNQYLQTHFKRMRTGRSERVAEMAQRVAADYPIDIARIMDSVGESGTLGRPHIADELVRIGVVQTRSEAFAEIIRPGSKYYVRSKSPNLLDAISWINDAGGKAVIAHPKAISRGKILSDDGIRESAAAGVFGIEVWHRDNPDYLRKDLRKLADQLGLAEFGASDYHGRGKPNLLGENTTPDDVYRQLSEGTFGQAIEPK